MLEALFDIFSINKMQENTNIVPKETLKRPSQENNREPILKYLCIYTLKLGQKEDNRHEQILYYGTPENGLKKPQQQEGQRIQTVPLDTQLRQVGLAQAMMNFSK